MKILLNNPPRQGRTPIAFGDISQGEVFQLKDDGRHYVKIWSRKGTLDNNSFCLETGNTYYRTNCKHVIFVQGTYCVDVYCKYQEDIK